MILICLILPMLAVLIIFLTDYIDYQILMSVHPPLARTVDNVWMESTATHVSVWQVGLEPTVKPVS